MKHSSLGEEHVSYVFIDDHMFLPVEYTGILLGPAGRIAFQNGGSTIHVGSERSLLSKLQFPEGSIAVGVFLIPNNCGCGDARLGIVESSLPHLSGKFKENPLVIWR